MYSILKMQFSSAMKNLNLLLIFDHVIPTLGICPEGERRGSEKDSNCEERERERETEGREFVHTSVCVWECRDGVNKCGWAAGSQLPSSLALFTYSLTTPCPSFRKAHWGWTACWASSYHRELVVKFNIIVGSSTFFQHHKLTFCW